jgi:glycogen synthase kinase 3 beta
VAVKQILEDETMMNRETAILQQIKNHPNIINLRHHFYTTRRALTTQEHQQNLQIQQTSTHQEFMQHAANFQAGPNKKFLNLVTDFMPLTLSKWNLNYREAFKGGSCDPARVSFVKQLMHQFLSGI